VVAVSFGLAALGALLGVGGAWALWTHLDLQKLTNGFLIYFEVTPRIMAWGAAVAAIMGVVAALPPAWQTARMSVTEGLKTLD
jgi:ABC-type antimicrobial peptide transport system permease subunit